MKFSNDGFAFVLREDNKKANDFSNVADTEQSGSLFLINLSMFGIECRKYQVPVVHAERDISSRMHYYGRLHIQRRRVVCNVYIHTVLLSRKEIMFAIKYTESKCGLRTERCMWEYNAICEHAVCNGDAMGVYIADADLCRICVGSVEHTPRDRMVFRSVDWSPLLAISALSNLSRTAANVRE
jgi:hypothetical protein